MSNQVYNRVRLGLNVRRWRHGIWQRRASNARPYEPHYSFFIIHYPAGQRERNEE